MEPELNEYEVKARGFYAGLPVSIDPFWINLFYKTNKVPYMTDTKDINLMAEDFKSFAPARFFKDFEKVPPLKVNGVDNGVIVTENFGGSKPLGVVDNSKTVTIGAKVINSWEYVIQKREKSIKDSIDLTMSRMNSQSVVLSGYEMEETGTKIDFNLEEVEEIDAAEIKSVYTFITDLIDDYTTNKEFAPDFVGLGSQVFDKVVTNSLFLEVSKVLDNKAELTKEERQLVLNVISEKMVRLPRSIKNLDGELIDISDRIIILHTSCLIPAHGGVVRVTDDGKTIREMTTELIEYIEATKENKSASIQISTAYVPIVLREGIKRYIVKNIDKLGSAKETEANNDALIEYLLSKTVPVFTTEVASILDAKLLNELLIAETAGQSRAGIITAINTQLATLS